MDADVAFGFLGHFSVLVFYLFITFLCLKMTARASEGGALHNRQICPQAQRAAKLSVLSPQITLMWNNSAFCLWCFSSSYLLLLLLPYHLCYPELTSNCTDFFPSPFNFYVVFLSVLFLSLLMMFLWLHFNQVLLLYCLVIVSAASQCFGSQSAWTADRRVSGCSLPDPISSQ